MKRVAVALGLAALCSGCATVDWLSSQPEKSRPAPPASLMARADELIRQGQPLAARDLYVRIAAEPALDAAHARALYSLARLYTDPTSGLRNYRAASMAFDRLLKEYPRGEWEADARAWRAALTDLAAREVELEARDGELGMREAEVARLRSEAARLGADLQRLRKIDLNLERRR
jgi:outer membrane protein assembly factor BamD (BamD/ComL family)